MRPRRAAPTHVCRRGPDARPSWGSLYLVVVIFLAGLALTQLVVPAGSVRHVLVGLAVVFTFAALRLWIRANRVALVLEDEAACCTATVTIRVVGEDRRSCAGRAVQIDSQA